MSEELQIAPEKQGVFKRILIAMLVKQRPECLRKWRESSARWASKNKAQVYQATRSWQLKNPERTRQLKDRSRRKNQAKVNQTHIRWVKKKRLSDPNYRMIDNLRLRLRRLLKVKNAFRKFEIFGCSAAQLKSHIESLFLPGMSWGNYGKGNSKWVIDHKIPGSKFDHSNDEQLKSCWNFRNLQPLWWIDNLIKSDSLEIKEAK